MSHLITRRSIASTRSNAAWAAHEANIAALQRKADADLEGDIKCFQRMLTSLKHRTGQFAKMTVGKRDAVLCDAGFGRPVVLADICELSDDLLIEIAGGCAAEIEHRAMRVELSPEARRAVEQAVIDNDADDRFDASFFATAY